jgi:hypothetical protein
MSFHKISYLFNFLPININLSDLKYFNEICIGYKYFKFLVFPKLQLFMF